MIQHIKTRKELYWIVSVNAFLLALRVVFLFVVSSSNRLYFGLIKYMHWNFAWCQKYFQNNCNFVQCLKMKIHKTTFLEYFLEILNTMASWNTFFICLKCADFSNWNMYTVPVFIKLWKIYCWKKLKFVQKCIMQIVNAVGWAIWDNNFLVNKPTLPENWHKLSHTLHYF